MDVAKPQIINDEEEDELWKEFSKSKSSTLRDKIIRKYMPLVKYVAGKVSVGLPASMEFDDLVGFGQFGLLDAINKYDLTKKVKFKTYAVTRIRGAIFDEMRQLDWVPRSVRQKTREIEDIISELEAKLSRPATDAEIAKEMNITEEEYQHTVMKISGTSVLSLNDVWYSGDDSDHVSIGDSIESPQSLNPDVQVEREEIRKVIIQAINELPEKEKMVIVLYYHEDLTFKEIGQVLDVSESRISQLHSNANVHLRAKLTNFRKGIF
ncbi:MULTISPECIES: RNA polymerase sigma factor WhiG [Treponema]|jgi:RNA polymerase sigma factor for flagellar operon FliA|uniref:RNA polymerase, sigma 28 subunit, SigD/FliA/WhiG n=2 Tax=Treponema saccharophilum TaxID=165 RepID=H7EPA1_9SPIR|nr:MULTISPECIES: RNA polymerase sigma factor WhiG [Treponema]EIC00734.1 RNA polymerase, sigma 28 subunit, SigD/FliA/WhiG [Treponema saccharophilum DSM 2985]MBQ5537673.1 RNA polymerase sigma factor WhiG [Treponema sp.]BDC95824.1 RNA polymerase sigma factor WhiG [Treponema saccharophilum]